VCVRSSEGLSGCFQSVLGVKQGCPLSPLLFGIFLDDWEGHLQSTLGAAAALPLLSGRTIPPLLFADDMLLVATSAAGLQAQLRCLQEYCDAKKLTVNAAKTQVLILRPGGGGGSRLAAGESFTYAGKPLQAVASTKYLGLTLSQLSKQRGFAGCADVLARAGRQAMFATRRRAWELGCCTVEQQCALFDVFVTPVLSYGCEIWGPDLLLQQDCSSVERVHRWFCRRIQGLPPQATSAVSLAELGRQPLHLRWVQQLVRFWNRLQASMAEPDSLLGWALADNLALMREGADVAAGSACWCRRWLQFLQSAPTDSGTLVWLTQLDEGAVAERAAAAYLRQSREPANPSKTPPLPTAAQRQRHHGTAAAAAAPTAVASSGLRGSGSGSGSGQQQPPLAPSPSPHAPSSKFAYYLDCIRGDLPLSCPSPHLHEVTTPAHRIALSRFRTSCHDLRIERERYLPRALQAPRHERTCLQCASPAIEDETHMVFHCPVYNHLRFTYADLFPLHLPDSIPCFLSQDQTRVAAFIHDCQVLRRRNACMSLAGSGTAL
jgi:reverse transcriptase-like protein